VNVLSLFDGMSCGQIALDRAGIKYHNYFASEVDKYAIKVTQRNYSPTIQLGDITKIKSSSLSRIDLLIGGSPCQGFSYAGKHLNFKDPRSSLFFEYIRLLKECKPKYFLLENVMMKPEYNDVISRTLGELYPECVYQFDMLRPGRLEPVHINSALVSAQNRKRLYWTNIPNIEQPYDKKIFLKDILENGCDTIGRYARTEQAKAQRKINVASGRDVTPRSMMELIPRTDHKSNTLTCVQKDNYVLTGTIKKNNKLTYTWRNLTPLECERLQTVPDNYTDCVSNSQRYKMLGNGWTVDVVKHIFSNLKF